ncbi:MAG: hypothetical protein KJ697_02570 [Nanoarchaeota archaeon]|nr:hypothetical protein [Nanoarchaeota archaeon]MBU4124010.1 hypothetical protein [Nanoarchaeota archaeon]
METRIYKIEPASMGKIKGILEGEDRFDVSAICSKCNKTLEGLFSVNETSRYQSNEDSRGKIKPPEKKCECGGEYVFEKKVLAPNEFARNGYTLRGNDLLIIAEKEFFDKNEPLLTKEGAVQVKGVEAEEVQKKIKDEEDSAACGVGLIFG